MKLIAFQGTSLDDLRAFPVEARREAGHQLDRVQRDVGLAKARLWELTRRGL